MVFGKKYNFIENKKELKFLGQIINKINNIKFIYSIFIIY